VLAAATHRFAVNGYRGASVAAIAADAGISEGYVFRLYGDELGCSLL
jgi:AcrR family transcriptional regulator